MLFWFSSEGNSFINTIDPAYIGKVRAKVEDVFQFKKEEDVSAHYKMIEQLLEDEKMVSEAMIAMVTASFSRVS